MPQPSIPSSPGIRVDGRPINDHRSITITVSRYHRECWTSISSIASISTPLAQSHHQHHWIMTGGAGRFHRNRNTTTIRSGPNPAPVFSLVPPLPMRRYKVLRNRKRVGEEFLAPQFNPSVQAVEWSKFPLLPSIPCDTAPL